VVYDPNFRKSHLDELGSLKPLIIDNMRMSSLIRGSDEDFKNIFRVNSPDEAWEVVRNYCSSLVYTANTDGVYVRTNSFSGKFPVKIITPVSTIGAGDNFNAGMITSIYRNNISRDQLSAIGLKEWTSVIETAVDFATHVCLSYDNYISEEFARELKIQS
jgi:fructokinase